LSDHLSSTILNALADGELSGTPLARANEHLAACPQCTSNALAQSLLKSATARSGQRYSPPSHLREQLIQLASQKASHSQASSVGVASQRAWAFSSYGWAASVALLLVCVSLFFVERRAQRASFTSSEYAALATEVCDQHIATLAANSPPQVISSDRHTVKPWFQGKIPFSFNLPQNLPADTTLDGANLAYLHNQPTAQLLYSIGRHRVSVFVQQKRSDTASGLPANHSGFHLTGFHTDDLDVVAVSDVDPVRLADLVGRIEQAQPETHEQPK
jgi:anti-sigma factor RsiW